MVSVALCTYNGEKFLKEQLESLAAQTVLPGEVVICDDVSTDNTLAVIEAFRQTHPPFAVHVHRNETRAGVTANFFKAIQLCTGDYIALCDQDDVWLPYKLQTVLEFFQKPENSHIEVVFSDLALVDEQLRPLDNTMWNRLGFTGANREEWKRSGGVEYMLHKGNVMTGASAVLRSSFKQRIAAFAGYPFATILHDYVIALAAALEHKLAFIEIPLVLYRQHTSQQLGARDFRLPFLKKLKLIKQLGSRKYKQVVLTRFRAKLNDLAAAGIDEQNSEYYRLGIEHLNKRTAKSKTWFHKAAKLTPEFTKGRYSTYVHSALLSYLNDLLTGTVKLLSDLPDTKDLRAKRGFS